MSSSKPISLRAAAAVVAAGFTAATGFYRLVMLANPSPSPKKFYIFGSPVDKSPSPLMHNTGFWHSRLPHYYRAEDTTDVERCKELMMDPDFGGASVTIPMKEKLFHLIDEKSDSVKAIGALNTIIPKNGKMYAENTDWAGIVVPLMCHLPKSRVEGTKGVVVGAGGTARAAIYALKKLGYSDKAIFVYNKRTPSKAEKLAGEFNCQAAQDMNELKGVSVLICTLPPAARYVAPKSILDQKPVIFEACYLPPTTALSAAAKEAECVMIQGLDMLIAQGVRQFELWTGVPADKVLGPIDKATREMYRKTYIEKEVQKKKPERKDEY